MRAGLKNDRTEFAESDWAMEMAAICTVKLDTDRRTLASTCVAISVMFVLPESSEIAGETDTSCGYGTQTSRAGEGIVKLEHMVHEVARAGETALEAQRVGVMVPLFGHLKPAGQGSGRLMLFEGQ